MAARRLILILLVLLMISSFAAALVPIERESRDESSSSTTTTTEPVSPTSGGQLLERSITDSAKPQTVRIELGDQLRLAVESNSLDEVEIPALGELEDVEPGSPALFDILPFEVGEYPVRLVDSNHEIGVIEVVETLGKAQDGGGMGGSGGKQEGDGLGGNGQDAVPQAETSSS